LPRRNTSKFGVISPAGSCSLERLLVMMKRKQQDSLFGSRNFDETASAIVTVLKLHFFHST
jgi:hypothetical protein